MRLHTQTLTIATPGAGFTDITGAVAGIVADAPVASGLATLFIRHTSASLTIQENADPDVLADLHDFFARIAPVTGPYRHAAEGPDDMPAHLKAALTATSVSVPVEAGRLLLGTWQGIYVFEHRSRPHTREVIVQVMGVGANMPRG